MRNWCSFSGNIFIDSFRAYTFFAIVFISLAIRSCFSSAIGLIRAMASNESTTRLYISWSLSSNCVINNSIEASPGYSLIVLIMPSRSFLLVSFDLSNWRNCSLISFSENFFRVCLA